MAHDVKIQLLLRDTSHNEVNDSILFHQALTQMPAVFQEETPAATPLPFEPLNTYSPGDWLFILFFSLLLCLGLLLRIFRNNTFAVVKEFFGEVTAQNDTEESLFGYPSGKYLTLTAAAGVGVFTFLGIDYFTNPELGGLASFGLFLVLTLAALISGFLKLLLYEVLARLFDLKNVTGDFYRLYFGFLIVTGHMLLAVSVILAYIKVLDFEVVFLAGCAIAGLLYITQLIKVFLHYTFHYRFSPGYNILYLCSLEIIPVLLVIMHFVTQSG